MLSFKATLSLGSLVSGLTLSLLRASQLRPPQQQLNPTNSSLQLLNQIIQSGNFTSAITSPEREEPISITRCDARLGQDLLYSSCADAMRQLDIREVSQTWGPRGMGSSQSLPRRTISSKWSMMTCHFRMNSGGSSISPTRIAADGLCVIDPVLSPGKLSATATFWDVAVGAAAVVQKCVIGGDRIGGSTRNISKRR